MNSNAEESERDCEIDGHEWVVFSTALGEHWLMVQCVNCGAHGTVDEPSTVEWSKAFTSPTTPYRWSDNTRVTLRSPPGSRFYVARARNGYERIPRELMGELYPVTPKEKADLESLAKAALSGDLCGMLFPHFIRFFQDHTGREPTGAAKRAAAQIEKVCKDGTFLPPAKVASMLKWFAREGKPEHT